MNVRNLFWETDRKTTKTIADTIVSMINSSGRGCLPHYFKYNWLCWQKVSDDDDKIQTILLMLRRGVFSTSSGCGCSPFGTNEKSTPATVRGNQNENMKNLKQTKHKAWTIDVKYDDLYHDEIEGENGFHGNTWCVEVDCCGLTELWRTHWVVRPGAAQSKTQNGCT